MCLDLSERTNGMLHLDNSAQSELKLNLRQFIRSISGTKFHVSGLIRRDQSNHIIYNEQLELVKERMMETQIKESVPVGVSFCVIFHSISHNQNE